MSATEQRIKAAQWFAGQGFGILPVWSCTESGECRCPPDRRGKEHSPGKHPILHGGKWHVLTDPERIRTALDKPSLPNYGLIPPEHVVALDVDGSGLERLAELEAELGPLPETMQTITPNGRHMFLYLNGADPGGNLHEFVTRRHDPAGMVIGPGSVHPSGKQYGWNRVQAIAPMPEAWVPKPKLITIEGDGHGYQLPERVPAGGRYDAILRYVGSRYMKRMTKAGIWAAMQAELVPAFAEPLSEPELRSRFERAWKGTPERLGDPMPEPVSTAMDTGDYQRPSLSPVATMTAAPESARPLVPGLITRGQLVVLAAVEGLGKSTMRDELAIRGALGRGPLWGYFAVPEPFTTAVFDEENGTALELDYDGRILDYIGASRDELGDRLQRASYAGIDLDSEADRAWLAAEVARTRPDLLVLDTGGQMVADEWGSQFKTAMRYLRSLAVRYACAVLIVVHMTKPPRDQKGHGLHGTKLQDVMGQWTRSTDVVILAADLGEGRARIQTYKRCHHVVLVIQQDAGAWRLLNVGEAEPAKDRNDDRVLRAIAGGLGTAEDIRDSLGVARRTVFDCVKRLRADGLVDKGTPYRLTKDGEEAL